MLRQGNNPLIELFMDLGKGALLSSFLSIKTFAENTAESIGILSLSGASSILYNDW
jgi:hypothetical protein